MRSCWGKHLKKPWAGNSPAFPNPRLRNLNAVTRWNWKRPERQTATRIGFRFGPDRKATVNRMSCLIVSQSETSPRLLSHLDSLCRSDWSFSVNRWNKDWRNSRDEEVVCLGCSCFSSYHLLTGQKVLTWSWHVEALLWPKKKTPASSASCKSSWENMTNMCWELKIKTAKTPSVKTALIDWARGTALRNLLKNKRKKEAIKDRSEIILHNVKLWFVSVSEKFLKK